MTRTPFLRPEEMNVEQRRIYDDIVKSRGTWLNGPYAPMLHQPLIAEPAQKLGEFVRYKTSLPPRLSELAILLVARHYDCEFEWFQHQRIAVASGVSPALVEAVRTNTLEPRLDEDESRIYKFSKSLLETNRVPEHVYIDARDRFGVVGVVELTALLGYYALIAFTLNAHEVPLPHGSSAQLPARQRGHVTDAMGKSRA
jgi:4-carboxymuconolactone decarboxylase